MRSVYHVIQTPRARGSLLGRLLERIEGVTLGETDPFLGRNGWKDAVHAWSQLLGEDDRLILLRRCEEETEISMAMTWALWGAWGNCNGRRIRKVREMMRSMEDFQQLNPERVMLIESEELLDHGLLAEKLARWGLSLPREVWEEEVKVVSRHWRSLKDATPKDALDREREENALDIVPGTWIRMTNRVRPREKNSPRRYRMPMPVARDRQKIEVHTIRFGAADWLETCAPTLDEWCARHGLQLHVWGNTSRYPTAKFQEIDMLREFLQRDAEWMIYIDADVYVHPAAPVPHFDQPGFWIMADRPCKQNQRWAEWCQERFSERPKRWIYRNAGVWACDRAAAAAMLEVIAPPYRVGMQEQNHWNWWLRAAAAKGMPLVDLPDEWNRFPRRGGPAWFFHLAGRWKMEKLAELREKRLLPQVPESFVELPAPDVPFAIVYPWKADAARWEELRYSLRSVEKHFRDKECPILILGDRKPDWLVEGGRVRYLPVDGYAEALTRGVQMADRVLWMNDDIYLLADAGPEDFETAVHMGGLMGRVGSYSESRNSWQRGVARAVIDLHHMGIEDPLNFSTHTPYLYERPKALETLRKFGNWHKVPFETLYYNHHGTPCVEIGERKVKSLPAGPGALYLNHNSPGPDETTAAALKALFPSRPDFEAAPEMAECA